MAYFVVSKLNLA